MLYEVKLDENRHIKCYCVHFISARAMELRSSLVLPLDAMAFQDCNTMSCNVRAMKNWLVWIKILNSFTHSTYQTCRFTDFRKVALPYYLFQLPVTMRTEMHALLAHYHRRR